MTTAFVGAGFDGQPHRGHAVASLDTRWAHSRQAIRDIASQRSAVGQGTTASRKRRVPRNRRRLLSAEKNNKTRAATPLPGPHPPLLLLPLSELLGGTVPDDEMVSVKMATPVPSALIADNEGVLTPAVVGVPVMAPVAVASVSPVGRPTAAKLVGWLVAVMV